MSRQPPTQTQQSGPATFVTLRDSSTGHEVAKVECYEEPNVLGPDDGYGYFPLALGQFIKGGKFEIVRKLGFGLNSTVWLARTHDDTYPVKYVAVKMLTLDASSNVFNEASHEPEMLKRVEVQANGSRHVGSRYCLRMFDMFLETSHHGPHLCLVMEMLGGTLADLRRTLKLGNAFPIVLVKRIMKQKLQALDFLHRTCGIVHTDVKPDNVLVHVPNIDAGIEQTLKYDPSSAYPPRIEPLVSPEPILTVRSQPLIFTHDAIDHQTIEIRLADFGEAQEVNKRTPVEVQALQLRAPEVILGYPWSTAIDIWSLGCLIFEYLTGVSLFHLTPNLDDGENASSHLHQMMEITGEKFETGFLSQCSKHGTYFDPRTCNLLRSDKITPRPLEGVLKTLKVHEQDIVSVAPFIRKCLIFDPKRRPSADQLLKDSWLQ